MLINFCDLRKYESFVWSALFDSEKDMDSNFRTAIESLNQTTDQDDNFQLDIVQLELSQRKFEVELLTKRTQVTQLREEIDNQNQIDYDLKRNLDIASAKIASLIAENHIWKQSCGTLEATIRNQLLVDKKFQYEAMMSENASLKELLQKSEMEKRKLRRQIDDLSVQQTIHSTNMQELLEQDQQIRSMIEDYKKTFDQIGNEKEKVIELYQKLEELKNHEQQVTYLKEKIGTSASKFDKLEEHHSFTAAKLNMLEELLQKYTLPQPNEPTNLQEYYVEKLKDYERHLKIERELVVKLQERLCKEAAANIYLCNKVSDLEKKTEELEKKLAQ